MNLSILLLMVAGLLIAAPADDKNKKGPKGELKKLEGNWQMVEGELGNNADGRADKKRLIIEDGVATLYYENTKREEYKLSLNPRANPKTIDLTTVGGTRKVSLGIYRLTDNGNKLEICRNDWDNKKRPAKFSTKPGVGNGFIRHVFKREKE